jgi:hypothetical protein
MIRLQFGWLGSEYDPEKSMAFATTGAVEMAVTAKAIDAAFCRFFGIPQAETPDKSTAHNRPVNFMAFVSLLKS